MTVIRRSQQNCCNYSSTNNSDTESLQLGSAPPSDTESVHNEPSTPATVRYRLPVGEELIDLKKSAGKKKIRRYQNRCILQTLSEEEESEEVPVLVEPYKSPFARLLEDSGALAFWNDFIEKSEDEQSVIMESMSRKHDKLPGNREGKILAPLARISSKIKRTIKVRQGVAKGMMDGLEKEIVNFFKQTPKDIYTKVPRTSFERLLLHAIAQFHDLNSISILTDDMKKVQVQNLNENWIPADCYLCEVISKKNS